MNPFINIAIGTKGRSTAWSEGKPEGGDGGVPNGGECKPPQCITVIGEPPSGTGGAGGNFGNYPEYPNYG